jgi:hypothetical protein
MVVGGTEAPLDRLAERLAPEHAPVVPAPRLGPLGPDGHAAERLREAQAVEDPRRVRRELDAGAHLPQGGRLLEDGDGDPRARQRERRRQASDARADHRDIHGGAMVSQGGCERC